MPRHSLWLAVLLAVTSSAAACSSDDDSTAATSTGARGEERCDDEPVQMGSEGETVVRLVEEAASANDLTSVVYRVTRDRGVVAAGAVGESLTGVPAEQAMHFRIGNVAFAYMGMLLLLFDESGKASLDDPVSKWLPDLDLPNADQVTLEMLVQNTSGYPDYVPNDALLDAFYADPFQQFTPQDLIDIGLSMPPWYEPGTAWSYAHTNYVILGEALAAIGEDDLGTLFQERIIDPMGLEDTAPALTPEVPEPVLHSFSTERDVFEDTTFWNPSWQTAPGSVLTSNICDVAASAAAVGSGDLLTDESYDALIAPDTVALDPPPASCPEGVCRQNTEELYYGLGVIVWSDWIVQTPLFGGAGAVHAYLPQEDLAVAIVAVTGQDSEVGINYGQQIWAAIASELTPENVPTR
jgi:D-alanyl-D-alanine carboxypeptidase